MELTGTIRPSFLAVVLAVFVKPLAGREGSPGSPPGWKSSFGVRVSGMCICGPPHVPPAPPPCTCSQASCPGEAWRRQWPWLRRPGRFLLLSVCPQSCRTPPSFLGRSFLCLTHVVKKEQAQRDSFAPWDGEPSLDYSFQLSRECDLLTIRHPSFPRPSSPDEVT